jgi:hypothetical protein
MTFLPEDYEAPKSAGFYMKLQDGENRIRILSNAIVGWEDWIEKKPVRYRMDQKPKAPHDAKKPIRHFWAFIVWNYAESKIQILQICQAKIRKTLESLCQDSDWGNPWLYDIKIIKTGVLKDTEYMVNPLPHKPVTDQIKEAFHKQPCSLEALFEGVDPFASGLQFYTPGMFDIVAVEKKEKAQGPAKKVISESQVRELGELLLWCDSQYLDLMWKSLEKEYGVRTIEEIPADLYNRLSAAAKKNANTVKNKVEKIA